MTWRYVSGPGCVVVRGDVVVMLPSTPDPALVTRLWDALGPHGEARPGVLDALGVLTADAGPALATLPAFVIAAVAGRQAHLLVRGECTAVGETADGLAVVVDGAGVSTWSERLVPDVVGLTLHATAERQQLALQGTWPVEAGVVAASAVALRVEESAPVSAGTAALGVVSSAPGADRPVPDVADPTEAAETAQTAEETYGHLWGSTVLRAVEAAAVRVDEEDEADHGHDAPAAGVLISGVPGWAAPSPSAPSAPEPSAPAAAPAEPAERSAAPAATAAAPAEPAAPAAAPPHPVPVPEQTMPPEMTDAGYGADLDHDGSTILSAALAELRAAVGPAPHAAEEPGAASRDGGPQILARTCAHGHVNPPSRSQCRTCGQPLTGDAALCPRPVLGRVRVSTGEEFDLDRPVVVGRRPRAPRTSDGDGTRLVTVPSPSQDISRSHLEVRLDGWHVLVADLATTNGTTLLRTGQPPLRLHPHEGVLVVDGDVVDLGDGVTCTFEEVW